jgi:hypothetical protein
MLDVSFYNPSTERKKNFRKSSHPWDSMWTLDLTALMYYPMGQYLKYSIISTWIVVGVEYVSVSHIL